MKTLTLVFALFVSSACGGEDGGSILDSTLTIQNNSSVSIYEIYISSVDSQVWGADQLGSDTLDPGDVVEFSEIDCDVYDMKVVDEEGDECVLTDIDFCVDDDVWIMTDADLIACQFAGLD